MVLTPTYHVFELYKAHQEGLLVPSHVETDESAPGVCRLSASASRKDNTLTVTVVNTSATDAAEAVISLSGARPTAASGRMLAGDMHDKNDFQASPVAIQPMEGLDIQGDEVRVSLPACAVAEVTITL